MKQVYKYPIEEIRGGANIIPMPKGAKILSLQVQNGAPCLWAEVDADAPLCDRIFLFFTTGGYMPEDQERQYIGTILLHDGTFVLHAYELLATEGEKA